MNGHFASVDNGSDDAQEWKTTTPNSASKKNPGQQLNKYPSVDMPPPPIPQGSLRKFSTAPVSVGSSSGSKKSLSSAAATLPGNVPRDQTLFVSGLPFLCTSKDLEEFFLDFGKTLDSTRVVYDKGFGFVDFATRKDAENAFLASFGPNRMRIQGLNIKVERCDHKFGAKNGSISSMSSPATTTASTWTTDGGLDSSMMLSASATHHAQNFDMNGSFASLASSSNASVLSYSSRGSMFSAIRRKQVFTVYLGNIPSDAKVNSLIVLAGNPENIRFKEKMDGLGFRFGFLEFSEEEDALRAMTKLSQVTFNNDFKMVVEMSKSTAETLRRRSSSNGGDKPAKSSESSRTVKIIRVPAFSTTQDVEVVFKPFGKIESVKMIDESVKGRPEVQVATTPKPKFIITYENEQCAAVAIAGKTGFPVKLASLQDYLKGTIVVSPMNEKQASDLVSIIELFGKFGSIVSSRSAIMPTSCSVVFADAKSAQLAKRSSVALRGSLLMMD